MCVCALPFYPFTGSLTSSLPCYLPCLMFLLAVLLDDTVLWAVGPSSVLLLVKDPVEVTPLLEAHSQ